METAHIITPLPDTAMENLTDALCNTFVTLKMLKFIIE